MGLDWCLKSHVPDKSPLELIGAKRFDSADAETVAVARKIIASHREAAERGETSEEHRNHWLRPESEILADMQAAPPVLVDTLDKKKLRHALPSLASPFYPVGVESFRGKRVEYCDLLPDDLRDKAYQEMDAAEMARYANELEAYVPKTLPFDYEAEKTKADKLDLLESDGTIPDEFWDVATLKDAVAWLRFWAQHPVSLVPWY